MFRACDSSRIQTSKTVPNKQIRYCYTIGSSWFIRRRIDIYWSNTRDMYLILVMMGHSNQSSHVIFCVIRCVCGFGTTVHWLRRHPILSITNNIHHPQNWLHFRNVLYGLTFFRKLQTSSSLTAHTPLKNKQNYYQIAINKQFICIRCFTFNWYTVNHANRFYRIAANGLMFIRFHCSGHWDVPSLN